MNNICKCLLKVSEKSIQLNKIKYLGYRDFFLHRNRNILHKEKSKFQGTKTQQETSQRRKPEQKTKI